MRDWPEGGSQSTARWSRLEEAENGKVGRNGPCPCGSGKKYKRCCLPKTRGVRKFDDDESNLRDAILKFAGSERFRYDWKRGLDTYKLGSDGLELKGSVEEVEFIDWFVHDYRCVGSGEPLVKIFAREKAASLNERQRRILTEWQDILFGVYEVIGISEGESLRLKDVITGEEYFVYDVSVSNAATLLELVK